MDFITEFISSLGDLSEYFDYFVNLAINLPLLAIIIAIPLIAVFLYTFIERALDFLNQLKSNNNQDKNNILLIIILSISTFLSIIVVNDIVQANTVRPIFLNEVGESINLENNELNPIDLIGENISLKWYYKDENKIRRKILNTNKSFLYKIEYSDNKKFKNPIHYDFTNINNAEIEVTFNRNSYWRITPGVYKNQDLKTFKKSTLPSKPLKVLQYEDIRTRIQKEKQLRVCSSRTTDRSFLSYLPKGQSSLTADPIGLEPTLVKIIAENIFKNIIGQNGKVNYINLDWNQLLDDTGNGKCDMAIASISITKDRERDYSLRFSKPYHKTNLALIANQIKHRRASSTNQVDLLKKLQGKKVGVLGNSTSWETIEIFNNILKEKYPNSYKELLIKPKPYPRVEKALYNLVSTRPQIEFVLTDKVYTDTFLFGDNKIDITIIDELIPDLYPEKFPEDLIGENYGIAVNYTASDILEYINEKIEELNTHNYLEVIAKEHRDKYRQSAIQKVEVLHKKAKDK